MRVNTRLVFCAGQFWKREFLMRLMRKSIVGGTMIAILLAGWSLLSGGNPNKPVPRSSLVSVKVPSLGTVEKQGQAVFSTKCASCHGQTAAGINGAGPPLVHAIYRPSHHADLSFWLAAKRGVRAHHWRFGDMPPVEGITRAQIKLVVAYVRALQLENGIR